MEKRFLKRDLFPFLNYSFSTIVLCFFFLLSREDGYQNASVVQIYSCINIIGSFMEREK